MLRHCVFRWRTYSKINSYRGRWSLIKRYACLCSDENDFIIPWRKFLVFYLCGNLSKNTTISQALEFLQGHHWKPDSNKLNLKTTKCTLNFNIFNLQNIETKAIRSFFLQKISLSLFPSLSLSKAHIYFPFSFLILPLLLISSALFWRLIQIINMHI